MVLESQEKGCVERLLRIFNTAATRLLPTGKPGSFRR
jgi:hypothetical protein